MNAERFAFDILHRQKRPPVLLADVVDGANVGVVQRRGCQRFPPKTLQGTRIVYQIVRQEFQRDITLKSQIPRLVYNPHPSAAEFLDDSVMRCAPSRPRSCLFRWETPSLGCALR